MKAVETIKIILSSPFILLVKLYQWVISPLFPPNCRHYPTCSNYTLEAFKKHGPIKGLILGTWRILRCNPWGTHGFDPVPEKWPNWRKSRKDNN